MKSVLFLLLFMASSSLFAADTKYCDKWLSDIISSCEGIGSACHTVSKCVDIRSKCNHKLLEKYYGAYKFREKSCQDFISCIEIESDSGCKYEWSDYKCTAVGLGPAYSKCPGRVSLMSFFTDSFTVSDSWFDCEGQKNYYRAHIKSCVDQLDKSSETLKICDIKEHQEKLAKAKELVAFNKQVEADQMKIPQIDRPMREFYKYDRFSQRYVCDAYFKTIKIVEHDDVKGESGKKRSAGKSVEKTKSETSHSSKTSSY